MVFRITTSATAIFTLLSTILAIDCGWMCAMGGFTRHMDCWFAAHTGIPCDTGMLIGLLLATMTGSATTVFLWSIHATRA